MSLSKFFKKLEDDIRDNAKNLEEFSSNLYGKVTPQFFEKQARDPGAALESTFIPEFGAPEMRQSQQMLADALRANPVPTTDEARRSEDYMRQARRRRGRAASVLAGRSETSTPLGSTGAPPSYGARSVLG